MTTIASATPGASRVPKADGAGKLLAGWFTAAVLLTDLGLGAGVAGDLVYGSGANTLARLGIGTAGRLLVAGASVPAWSDSGLSYASSVLTVAGSVPGTPSAGQVVVGGGVVKAGGAISGASLTASGLTPGRVSYISTGGLLIDSANLTYTGSILGVGSNTTANWIGVNGPAGTANGLFWRTAGVNRWTLYREGAEPGGDAGGDLYLRALDDAGGAIGGELVKFTRAAGGAILVNRPVTCSSTLATAQSANSSVIGLSAQNTSNGTTADSRLNVINDGSNGVAIRSYSSGYSGSLWGITAAGLVAITNSGSPTAMVVGPQNDVPLVFIQNAAERIRIAAGGAISLTTAVTCNAAVRASTQLGVGTAASTSIGINVTQTALAGTTQYGHLLSVTGTSAATGAIQMLTVAPATAVASFTCAQVQGFRYQNVTIGAGSTVTTQYAILIDALSGAGTSYAFRSSGAGLVSIGDTTASASASTGALTVAGGVGIGGTINAANDTDIVAVIGRCKVGYDGANADAAVFAHFDRMSSTDRALVQGALGQTILNAASGQTVALRVNNTTVATVSATAFTMAAGSSIVAAACTTANASFNAPHGTAPTTPTNGDIWTTTAGAFARINGATVTLNGATPGGSDTHVQFNNAGALAGSADYTWNNTTKALGIYGLGTPAGIQTPVATFGQSSLCTLVANITDTYGAGIRVDGISVTGAFTITRHNYFYITNCGLAGGAAITDACLFHFAAAAGTHKAVDTGTTKTSPGTVSAWVKVNINGTVHYTPAYTSKTS